MDAVNNIIEHYGILTSASWNSNKWANHPTQEDLQASKYDYVKANAHMHESLNFGHEIFPLEDDNYYIGYTPMFNTKLPDVKKSANIQIVFFISSDYKNLNQKSIVGFYGFPEIDSWFPRKAKHPLYKKYDGGNICAHVDNIVFFDNAVIVTNESVLQNKLLPDGKKISQQGFNYLNSDNVYNLLVLALKRNPNNDKLKQFVQDFPLVVHLTKEENDLRDFIELIGNTTADIISDIEKLERKMLKQKPYMKRRISNYIERGAIANKIKKLTGYKCLVCESIGLEPTSFLKVNGEPYIETHHVDPVSSLKEGVLSVNNLITVCANHHRQLHYGDVTLNRVTERQFQFTIDNTTVYVNKIKLS